MNLLHIDLYDTARGSRICCHSRRLLYLISLFRRGNHVLILSLLLWMCLFYTTVTNLIYVEHRESALLQLHLHSRPNTWLQWIRQRQSPSVSHRYQFILSTATVVDAISESNLNNIYQPNLFDCCQTCRYTVPHTRISRLCILNVKQHIAMC